MKDGDKLLEELKQAAKRRNDIALMVLAVLYQPDWLYWMEYTRGNRN